MGSEMCIRDRSYIPAYGSHGTVVITRPWSVSLGGPYFVGDAFHENCMICTVYHANFSSDGGRDTVMAYVTSILRRLVIVKSEEVFGSASAISRAGTRVGVSYRRVPFFVTCPALNAILGVPAR